MVSAMENRPCITFLSDFGAREACVASVKGVILGICPEAAIVDVTHEVRSHDLLEAAFTLSCAYRWFPPRTIHLAVVDPGVGSARRAIVAAGEQHVFVAPDNGILSLVYESGEINRVHSIEAEHYFRHPVSPTFHGRDIFGPVAAQLARGLEVETFGPRIEDYTRLNLPPAKKTGDRSVEGIVLHIDKFGNVITSLTPADLERAFGADTPPRRVTLNGKRVDRICTHYAEAAEAELFALLGSSGRFELAALKRPAAKALEARRGQKVVVEV